MMKKVSVFAAVLLLLAAMAIPAFAAQTATLTVEASAQNVDRGDTVVITVSTSKVDECVSGGFRFIYDANVFEYVSGESALSKNDYIAGISLAAGNVAGFFMNGNKTIEGEIFKITLRVKDTAAYGNYTVSGDPKMVAGKQDVTCTANPVTVTVACKHSFIDYEKQDTNAHISICSKCGERKAEEHDWNDGVINVKPGCTQPGQETYTCLLCKETKVETLPAYGHQWDNECDTDCNNNCGYQRETTHNYATTFSADETGHWFSCTICADKKDFAAHVPGPEATNETPQLCTTCNYELAPATGHTHQMSTEWISNDTEHWHRCQITNPSCHYTEDRAPHDYDSDCDVQCNTCSFVRLAPPHNFSAEWEGNAEGHWYSCMDCGQPGEVYPHVPGPEATETTPQRCTECNIVIVMPLGHTHDFGDKWYSDETNHWQCCTDPECVDTTPMEPHSWDEGTELENGDTQFTCSVCGKQVVTAGEEPPTAPSTTPPTQPSTAPQQDGMTDGGFRWEWIGLAAVALLLIGIILLIIEFVRSRKVNSHGKFSK